MAGIFSGVKSWVEVSMAGQEPRYNPERGVLTESRAFIWEVLIIRDGTLYLGSVEEVTQDDHRHP